MDIVRIGKTMLPAVVVLVAGLFGINFVYNTYLTDGAASVITLEPAAGEEGVAVSIEDGATAATTTTDTTVATTEDVVAAEPAAQPAQADECAEAHAAAAEAIGTDAEENAAKAAKDCVDASNVKTAAEVVVEQSNDAAVEAVDAVAEEATEHLPVTDGDDAVPAAEEAAE